MRIAIYPGSFDPITKGHLDIIQRASTIFDKVIVVIMKNERKKYLFSEEERLDMIQHACAEMKNVQCEVGHGLTVRYAQEKNACAMIRGIRAVLDYEYELQTATANMWLDGNVETIFFLAKPEYSFISSSTVKEIASHKENVDMFVDAYTALKLKEKYE